MILRLLLLLWFVGYGGWTAQASPPIPQFEKEIQPIFHTRCIRCHGSKKQRAGLDLSTRAGVFKGSESGRVVVPGKPDKSLLFEMVHKGRMPPPRNEQLTKAEVERIRLWIAGGAPTAGAGGQSTPKVTQHDVLPMLRLRCTVCHGLRRQEAGLDLRSRASMLRGGKSGPAIVLGKPGESLVLKKIHAGLMPPRKQLLRVGVKPMPADEVEKLTRWIAAGAPEVTIQADVAGVKPDPLVTDKDRDFWSFRSPQPVTPPSVSANAQVGNPIDAFVLKKLEANGLTFSPQANKLTLIRRVTFDLIGLPPTPKEVQAFLADDSPNAYEHVVDRLLASPRHGERWARYWLDLAGYADSEGKRSADPVRPWAYRYRDYVIRAFNADKPYDRFLTEQLAGDELADYRNASTITPTIMDNLVATGFLRMAPDGTGSDIVNFVPERLEVISDELKVLGTSVLGLTIHCARCHSHKYDPIPQRDYYRLTAVFKGAYDEHDWLKPSFVPGQTKAKAPGRVMYQVTPEVKQQWEEEKQSLRRELARLKGLPRKQQTRQIRRKIRSLELQVKSRPGIRGLWDRGTPSPTYIYRRGDYLKPSDLVGPGVPSVLTDGKTPFEVNPPWAGANSTGRRLAFARWLTQPTHPLTARVMVNRIWKHHFGTGIVKTLDNFGKTGSRPTHPELLDWLALEFVRTGWSIKALHRLIVTSTAYRQSSRITPLHEKVDPENRLLARMSLQRMQAEVLYDSLLQVTGQLNQRSYGSPDPVVTRKDGLVTPRPVDGGYRRSIYVKQRRSQIPTLLETFDLPQMNPNCIQRSESTVASQALHLLNNARIENLAKAFANRVHCEVGSDSRKQVQRIYWLALSRPPQREELELGVQGLTLLKRHWQDHLEGTSEEQARHLALSSYAHTILNTAGFLYID